MASSGRVKGGWVQVNNTVVPTIERRLSEKETTLLVPAPVIKYGVGLLFDSSLRTLQATETEIKALSKLCRNVGLQFTFSKDLELMELRLLDRFSSGRVEISALHQADPFGSAKLKQNLIKDNDQCFLGTGASHSGALDLSVASNEHDFLKTRSNKRRHDQLPSHDSNGDAILSCDGDVQGNYKKLKVKVDQEDRSGKDPLDLSLSGKKRLSVGETVTDINNKAQQQQTPGRSLVEGVSPVQMFSTSLPSINRAGMKYILLDSLHKVFFPRWSYKIFLFTVTEIVGPPLFEMEVGDIRHVKSFCGNRVGKIRCNKAVILEDAKQALPLVKSFLKRFSQYYHDQGLSSSSRGFDLHKAIPEHGLLTPKTAGSTSTDKGSRLGQSRTSCRPENTQDDFQTLDYINRKSYIPTTVGQMENCYLEVQKDTNVSKQGTSINGNCAGQRYSSYTDSHHNLQRTVKNIKEDTGPVQYGMIGESSTSQPMTGLAARLQSQKGRRLQAALDRLHMNRAKPEQI